MYTPNVQRTDLQDTSREAHLQYVKLLREKGVEWRIKKTLELVDMNRSLYAEQTRQALLGTKKSS